MSVASRLSPKRLRANAVPHKRTFVRHAQAQALRAKTRGLLAHWFVPKWKIVERPATAISPSGKHALETLKREKAQQEIKLFNAPIARMVHFKRQERTGRVRKGTVRNILFAATDFDSWYASSRSDENRSIQDQKQASRESTARLRRNTLGRLDRQSHKQDAHNIGVNSILEVGRDPNGAPTHILLLKRSAYVPEAPHYWDPPAGLVRMNQKPIEVINNRVAAEVGVDPTDVRLIGTGLKPTKREMWFAMHHIGERTNYNAFVIQRVNRDVREIERTVRENIRRSREGESGKPRNPWGAQDFALIRRTPDAIRKFLREHDETWIPEVLRLYARELIKAKKTK